MTGRVGRPRRIRANCSGPPPYGTRHGTRSAYQKGCRGRQCVEAAYAYARDLYARRQATGTGVGHSLGEAERARRARQCPVCRARPGEPCHNPVTERRCRVAHKARFTPPDARPPRINEATWRVMIERGCDYCGAERGQRCRSVAAGKPIGGFHAGRDRPRIRPPRRPPRQRGSAPDPGRPTTASA